jgi:hypothetical protein
MEAGISKTHQIYYSEFASTLVAGVDGIVRDSREGGAYERDRFPPTAVWGAVSLLADSEGSSNHGS